MSIRNVLVSIAVASFLGLVAAGAGAQGKKAEGPCASEAKKFCGDVKPGQGRLAKCMKSHEAELSTACRNEMQARAEKVEQVRKDCRADAEKLCKGIKPGGGRIHATLATAIPASARTTTSACTPSRSAPIPEVSEPSAMKAGKTGMRPAMRPRNA
mgnify:CR=1 FL=1